MKNTPRTTFRIAAFVIVVTVSWVYWQPRDIALQVVTLNIGQGDAIYIRTPQGNDILVDGGPDRTVLTELGAVMPPFDHTIEYVIATHPDSDHIAGLMEVTDGYTVENLITNGHGKETNVFQQFTAWMRSQKLTPLIVRRGDRISIESDVWFEVLAPTDQAHKESNDDSIVMILHDRNIRIMLTGDASTAEEEDILAAYPPEYVQVDILKVGHHGSRFSTSNFWLNALQPRIALISADVQNRYHHPHPSITNRLRRHGIETFRTDTQGRITCRSDGETITCAPQEK